MTESPLITVPDLAAALSDVTLLDVRYEMGGPSGPDEFSQGHIPGAIYVDLDRDLAAEPGLGGRHPLPSPEAFEASMRRVGVSSDRPVVVYDAWQGRAAARAWWLLRHHGHADVRLLDGGWQAWRAAGHPEETGRRTPAEGDFTRSPQGLMPVTEVDEVLAAPVLVDARAPERYRGEVEPVDPVAGHIPGALNVPTITNLRGDGTFRGADELRALYAAAGVTGETHVTAYCGSGVTASHNIVAMEIAGIRAALYPGSWSGWVSDPDRPVETG